MDFNAFELISAGLEEALGKQGFASAAPMEDTEGKAVIFKGEDKAYSLLYDEKRQRFQLRSADCSPEGLPGEWHSVSLWLFDSKEGTRQDAESILNDFLEAVEGPRQLASVSQKKKRNREDERVIDPLFFLNRLVNLFPDLKEDMNQERIGYGQIRFVTFTKAHVISRVEGLLSGKGHGSDRQKLVTLLEDMYKDGDPDLRALITAVLLNGLSDEAFQNAQEYMEDNLKKASSFERRLKGKKIKPEKKKKEKKVVARLDG